jgi:environmental stress-induced protein Ves
MTAMHKTLLSDCPPQAWRNGGGQTRELLCWPPHSAPDDWALRVSVADIDRSGLFSAYPGIERWFAVLEGRGVALELPDGRHTLGPDGGTLRFDGEAAPAAHLIAGPTRDLNLMLRRAAAAGSMWPALPGSTLDAGARWRGLYVHAPARIACGGQVELLAAGTLCWTDVADAPPWHLLDDGRAFWLSLDR